MVSIWLVHKASSFVDPPRVLTLHLVFTPPCLNRSSHSVYPSRVLLSPSRPHLMYLFLIPGTFLTITPTKTHESETLNWPLYEGKYMVLRLVH